MIKEMVAFGAISLGSIVGVSCGEDNGKYLSAENNGSQSQNRGLKGDGFEINRIGENIFKLSGDDREAGTQYISERCKVLSVGAWQLDGLYGDSIHSVAVTVDDNNCLPELK